MSKKVLLVDDNADTVKVLSRFLKSRGYDVLGATDPARGLELAREGVGLVLLDLQMPEMGGLEFCKRLRKSPGTASIPVLFLSSIDLPEAREEARKAGAKEYLLKPVEESVLLEKMTRHFALPPRQVDQILGELGVRPKGP